MGEPDASQLLGGNNVPFGEVMRHFSLKLPPSAQKVVFTANVSPLFGEYSLSLRFTTTPARLRSFLSGAGLAPPSPDVQTPVDFGAAACGLDPPATSRMTYSQDRAAGPMAKSPRAVAVDLSDPAHPTVWLSAMDL